MIVLKALGQSTQARTDRDIILMDLQELAIKLHVAFIQKGVPEDCISALMEELPKHTDKKLFIQAIDCLLKDRETAEFNQQVILSEVNWLLRKENFRWTFEVFDLYDIQRDDLLE